MNVGLARRVLGAVGRTADESGEVKRLRELVASLERLVAARDAEIADLHRQVAKLGSRRPEADTPRDPPADAVAAQSAADTAQRTAPEPAPKPRTSEPAAAQTDPAPPPPKPRSLAEAIRQSGQIETGASFRLAAPGSDTSEEVQTTGTADVVLGEQYDTEVRSGPAGVYWGPIDNESARARALGQNLDIDRNACIGCGTCVENIDSVFYLNDDEGKAYVIRQEGSMDRIQDAIDACPVTCIHWS